MLLFLSKRLFNSALLCGERIVTLDRSSPVGEEQDLRLIPSSDGLRAYEKDMSLRPLQGEAPSPTSVAQRCVLLAFPAPLVPAAPWAHAPSYDLGD